MIQALSSEVGKAVTLRMSRVVCLAVSVGMVLPFRMGNRFWFCLPVLGC